MAELRRRQGRYDEAEQLFRRGRGSSAGTSGPRRWRWTAATGHRAMWVERFLRGYGVRDVVFRARGSSSRRARAAGARRPRACGAVAGRASRTRRRRVGRGPMLGTPMLAAAEVQLAQGQPAAGPADAEDAVDEYLRCGYRRRRAGPSPDRRGHRERAGRARAGPVLLTAREVDVLRLVAEGLTNASLAGTGAERAHGAPPRGQRDDKLEVGTAPRRWRARRARTALNRGPGGTWPVRAIGRPGTRWPVRAMPRNRPRS